MEINNKSIKGIFLYKDNVLFEKGDFVVEGNTLYIVKNNISGISPKNDKNNDYYTVYLGDTIANDEDFINYTKNIENDKLISATSISRILNRYMSGFNEKGIIDNYIMENGDIYIKDFCLGKDDSDNSSGYLNPLDKILVSKDLNNCIFAVSRQITESILGFNETKNLDTNYVILRQYTYKDNNLFVRIQELIDEEDGNIWFRYTKSEDPNNYIINQPWKSQTTTKGFSEKINSIISYYNTLIESEKSKQLVNNNKFCFQSIPILKSGQTYIEIPKNILSTITITAYKVNKDGLREIQSSTVNLSNSNRINISMLDGSIEIIKDTDNRYIVTENNINIDDIYGRSISN